MATLSVRDNMKDSEIRYHILKYLYDNRSKGELRIRGTEFGTGIYKDEALRVCGQLADNGLVNWTPRKSPHKIQSTVDLALVTINAFGVDVIEGDETPPLKIRFPVNKADSINDSNSNQAEDDIRLNIETGMIKLIEALNSSQNETEKAEAKERVRSLLTHPLTASTLDKSVDPLLAML